MKVLLVGRQNGSSSSRRQVEVELEDSDLTVSEWEHEGYNVFWLFTTDGERELRHWRIPQATA